MEYFLEHFKPDVIDSDAVFDESRLLQQIVAEKLPSWIEAKATSEERWLDLIKSLAQQNRPIKHTSLLVQYAFCIPGSSAEVERLFSIINDVWAPDKSNMKLTTLNAQLNVKVNSNMTCLEYYKSVKGNKHLLSQVQSNAKYLQPSTSTGEAIEIDGQESSEEFVFYDSE